MDFSALGVVVVEQDPLFRALLTSALAQSGEVDVVGSHCEIAEAADSVARLQPDVVIVGNAITHAANGIESAIQLQRRHPARLLILADRVDPQVLAAAEAAETWSYLLRSSVSGVGALLSAVRGTAQGFALMDPSIARWRRAQTAAHPSSQPRLVSARQEQILELVAAGRSNASIADELFISERSVESHLTRMYTAFGISTSDRDAHPRVQMTLRYLARHARPLLGRVEPSRAS